MKKASRELTAKYLSDISKGFLLAGVIGYFAGKLSEPALLAHILIAVQTFVQAYVLTEEQDQ